ncbi:Pattern recognition serine proteinase [Operophtera brumata]|uniref:Pattern recognition serine proteinase n=1 Tax=Operophtera brumata TaxID=104452 RepID=A0A0L7L908_OPEBR|nr:Pattern recognition serine proteinase [Operophtera brumata]
MPWHVGIYTKLVAPPMQVCGGSIVSARVVISGDYLVGAGKRYRPWNDRMDEHAQKTDDDLALVIVASPFIINAYVQPVCLDFDYGLDKKHLTDGTAVCMGDSGGGLSFPENSSSGMLFYLRGVVSTAPKSVNENLCNIFTFGTFTHIGKHEQFIREVVRVGAAEPLSVPSTPRQPPPDTPRNPKPFPFPEFKTGGKPKPLPKVTEDYTNDFFEPGTSRSDDATDVDYTVKVIEENLGTQTSPTTGTQPSDVDVIRTGGKPKSSDLFVPGTSRSDDATNVDYTVKGLNLAHPQGLNLPHLQGLNLVHLQGHNLAHLQGLNLVHLQRHNLAHLQGLNLNYP